MSISATVNRFAGRRVTVRRYEGFYDSGRYEKRLTETFEIRANVQPAKPNDLQRLPENYRQQGAYWIYPHTDECLRTGSAPDTVADNVEFGGVTYEIGVVDGWDRHTRYLAARAQQ